MRQGQPIAQTASGFARRRPIEGHEGGADPRCRNDVGAPAVALDARNLDVVRTTVDDFVEVMHEFSVPESIVGATLRPNCPGSLVIVGSGVTQSSERKREARVHIDPRVKSRHIRAQIFFC